MTKTVFLIGFLPNPRIIKRINLAKSYSNVHLICWDREKDMLETPKFDDVPCSIIKEKVGGNYYSRLFGLNRFKKAAYKILVREEPDIIHVQHLDMLQIACKYKNSHNSVHIIYEVADLHRLLVDEQKGIIKKLAQNHLRKQDIVCSRLAEILIVTSQMYYDTYFSSFVPEEKLFYFPNVPDLSAFENYIPKDHSSNFTIGYIGGIRYKNEIKLLINSVEKQGINLLVAGFEQGNHEIEDLCKNKENIQWLGRFDFKKDAAQLYGRCDCIFSVYDASMKNCRVALPNKLYEAVYCELPIIVADNTYVGDIVRDWGVGIPVIHNSQSSLDAAIEELKDGEKYYKYVENCNLHKEEINLDRYNELLKTKILNILNKV